MDFSYYSEIDKVDFYVLGSEENFVESSVSVTSKELFKGEIPVNYGCYDAGLGTTSYSYLCNTCQLPKGKCPGHTGSVKLNYPVKSPLFREEILKWLKIVCFSCGRLIVNKDITAASNRILIEYVKLAKGIETCPWPDCGANHPTIYKDKVKSSVFYAEYKNNKPIELFNHEIKKILDRIPSDTVTRLQKPLKSHPKNFVLNIIRAPPVTIRPDIRRIGGSRSNNNDVTALLKNIVEINDALPQEVPRIEEINKDLHEMYFNLDMTYYEMIKGSSGTNNQLRLATSANKAPNSIASRLSKKTGRIRKNLMGKRTHYMLRSVLSGNATLRIDEVGVPISFARALQIPETVRAYNREKLEVYFANKREAYPGCSGIHMKDTGRFHRIEHLDHNYSLQDGDVVMRDLIDGDYIGFNRQPSLLFSNISAMKVKVSETGLTLSISVSACSPFNADFDGDATNGIIAQNIQSRVELKNMSWIGNWFISYQNYSPYFGCYQDSLIGSAELTRPDTYIDKWHAMQLFPNISVSNNLSQRKSLNFNKSMYKGNEIVSLFLPEINYPKKKSKIYLPQYAPFINYDPDECFVQINRGQLLSGTLDKSTVGQHVMGSIFQVINNEYGADESINTIYNFHQITNRFFLWSGYTVGIKDVFISDEAMAEVKQKTQQMKEEALEITERLNRRELIAPIGMSLHEFYESSQLTALEPADNFVEPILKSIDFRNNSIARLIFTGSKGNETNLININGSYGQITINGLRPPRNFGWGRTSPYFLRYDMSPESLGFVDTSYREGIRSEVFPFAAGDARYSSISNALSTSVSGAQSRISIKNLESIIVNNLRQSAKDENIVQFLYADAAVDPRKMEQVKFLTIEISDKQMEEKFYAKVEQIAPKFRQSMKQKKDLQKLLTAEFEQLCKDRQEYRNIFLWAEVNNPGQYLIESVLQMPINPYRIIEDVLFNHADIMETIPVSERVLDPFLLVEKVKSLCETLPYLYFNTTYENRKRDIPEYIQKATTLVRILIRMYLCTANLLSKGIVDMHIDIIINKIKVTFKNALIDYGATVGVIAAECLSEPLTQYVLDSKHRGGGGGGTSFNVVERIKEIFGGRGSEKMKQTNMLITVKQEYENDKIKVQEIANYIEMMSFDRFIKTEHIFFEEYDNPVHPEFKHEKQMIKYFEKNNPGIKIIAPLSKWCVRYELNREEMIINSMKLDTIIVQLKLKYPDMFIVYTPETSDQLIVRCYIPQNMIKTTTGFNESIVFDLVDKINTTIIRGIKDITYAKVISIAKSEIQKNGSIASTKVYAISTIGSNLAEVLENPYIDPYHTQTNSIKEFEEMFGIEATREKIIRELRTIMKSDKVTRTHTLVFADEMTYGGSYTAIQRTGLQIREASNVTLRLSFQSPIQVLENAAINGTVDNISGVSGPLVVGQNPRIGTCYNNVVMHQEFIEDYYKTLGKKIEEEL